ncbi:GNAT family N-acetyltransferase [Flavivirga aquatica]|uniref:GNAT family N-acetyltransferase n=1 Tax=Flavivirga aquatica TaxID=1849968 RepID=A0A1E5T461_9FLAO|nr:GNAT family protein [Flavivirga aquatica]OEK06168.1 GNAT family N-acetyltransferase [Flavivirga aquatica]
MQTQLSFDNFYIEPIKIQDAWKLCDFIVANETRLKRYFPKTLEQNLTPDLSKLFVEKKTKQFKKKEEFLFTIKEKKTNHLVGLAYLKELDWNKKQGEFAYCTGYTFEGKKIMSKTIHLLANHAFNNLDIKTLQITVHKSNIASIKVAKNCNFTWVKTLKNEYTPIGEAPLDMELYELYNKTNIEQN